MQGPPDQLSPRSHFSPRSTYIYINLIFGHIFGPVSHQGGDGVIGGMGFFLQIRALSSSADRSLCKKGRNLQER